MNVWFRPSQNHDWESKETYFLSYIFERVKWSVYVTSDLTQFIFTNVSVGQVKVELA